MTRTQLRFESIQQIAGGEGIALVLLTDMNRQRVLTVVCDEHIMHQMLMRLKAPSLCRTMLPEVLLSMQSGEYELMVFSIYNGQYQVALMDYQNNKTAQIRMSDAVLLSLMSNIPIYIEDKLMARQSVPFDENAKGIAIPINTMDIPRLKMALQNAIDEENYELASQLRDEINRRTTPED